MPSSEYPIRSTTQLPDGGVQSSVPSERNLLVKSTTSPFLIASAGDTSGVAKPYKSGIGLNAAFSSKRFTRTPECSCNSAIATVVGGFGIDTPSESASKSKSPNGLWGGGSVLKVTRKYFAVVGAKEIVCSVEPPFGRAATTW